MARLVAFLLSEVRIIFTDQDLIQVQLVDIPEYKAVVKQAMREKDVLAELAKSTDELTQVHAKRAIIRLK